jgi:hypothetical protein
MIACRDLGAGIRQYEAILDTKPQQRDANTADFGLDKVTVSLTLPAGDDSQLADKLAHWGDIPYKLWLWTTQMDKAGQLDTALSHGATIELMA